MKIGYGLEFLEYKINIGLMLFIVVTSVRSRFKCLLFATPEDFKSEVNP